MERNIVTCPGCGKKLNVPWQPGMKDVVIDCPHCHYRASSVVFMGGNVDRLPDTPPALGRSENTHIRDDRPTHLLENPGRPTLCRLRLVRTGETTELREGSNVIGRLAATSTADIQIPNDMYMSRRHAQIDVVPRGCAFEYRLVEINSTNIIKLNGEPITRGDILLLNPGDVLTLGTTDVSLELVDGENTRLI